MEEELFTWQDWSQLDTSAFNFTNVVLVKNIGPYPAGTEFSSASLDFGKGVLSFYTDDEENKEKDFCPSIKVASFKLGLVVTAQLEVKDDNENRSE